MRQTQFVPSVSSHVLEAIREAERVADLKPHELLMRFAPAGPQSFGDCVGMVFAGLYVYYWQKYSPGTFKQFVKCKVVAAQPAISDGVRQWLNTLAQSELDKGFEPTLIGLINSLADRSGSRK